MTGDNDSVIEGNGLQDILSRRPLPSPLVTLPHRLVELWGGKIVPMIAHEPDPVTFRQSYYYNTSLNRLFRRLVTVNRPQIGVVVACWKSVGV